MFPALLIFVLLVFALEPWITYLWDRKALRRFPNATYLSGVSNLGFIIQRYRGFRSREIHEAHKQHPALRIGPNTISFTSPDAIRAIYGHSTPCTKGGSYERLEGSHPGLIDIVNKNDHARKRRILSNAFSTRNLEQWEFKISDKIQRLLHQFDRVCREATPDNAALDFRRWANLFTVEAIADIALSQHLGCLERGDDMVSFATAEGIKRQVPFILGLHAPRRAWSMLVWSTWFRPLTAVLGMIPGYFRRSWEIGERFTDLVKYLVRQRIQKSTQGDSFDNLTNCLLQDKAGQARNLDIAEVEGDMVNLLDAGSDTTATALTHVMYFLLKTPEALSRLREEVRTNAVFGADGVVTYASVKNLPYLRACLDESLRLLPPVSTGLHRLTPPEGYTIDGHWIPGGTIVAVPAYTAHRNPVFFPDPERFLPERWLEPEGKRAQVSFIPFSAGARGCLGRNITYIEQTMLLATLIQRYQFSFQDPEFQLDIEEAFLLWPGPMILNIGKRNEVASKEEISY